MCSDYLIVVLLCMSLMISDTKHLFTNLLAIFSQLILYQGAKNT